MRSKGGPEVTLAEGGSVGGKSKLDPKQLAEGAGKRQEDILCSTGGRETSRCESDDGVDIDRDRQQCIQASPSLAAARSIMLRSKDPITTGTDKLSYVFSLSAC